MNTKSLLYFFKKSVVTTSVGAVCGAIGFIEGAISGGTGAAILGHGIFDAAKMGAIGVGLLGSAEGLILGGLAVKGIFGNYETMREKGFKTCKDRFQGYIGYTANQIVGGITAGLLLTLFNSIALFGQIVSDIALGAAITGIAITPIVTVCATLILDWAYYATIESEHSEKWLHSDENLKKIDKALKWAEENKPKDNFDHIINNIENNKI